MGHLLSGLAIDKDFSNKNYFLLEKLSIFDYTFEGLSTFENEIFPYIDESMISIMTFGKGTFIVSSGDFVCNYELLKKLSTKNKVVSFYISEITSTYCFDYFEYGNHLRSKWISYSDTNIDSSENFGIPLIEEQNENDDLNIILNLISRILERNFYEIEEEEVMHKYKIVKY